jgi:adenylosuccinate lyase
MRNPTSSSSPLRAISPLDGRYRDDVQELSEYFSEFAYLRYCARIEIEWLITIATEPGVTHLRPLTNEEVARARGISEGFDTACAERVKHLALVTRHDIKALENFLRERLESAGLSEFCESVHFCCTSEDIANLAYGLIVRDAIRDQWRPAAQQLIEVVHELAIAWRDKAIVGRTHGQRATPTTIGKELAVFVARWERHARRLDTLRPAAKLNGAVGSFSAHGLAYPDLNWPDISKKFVESFGLEWLPLTTQVEPHDSMAEILHALARFNTVLRDFTQDVWLYCSHDVLGISTGREEVGSSTMPHKVNPSAFENAEGNAGLGSSILEFLARELPISRLQRDLSDSTKLRNLGVAFGYSLLAVRVTTRALTTLVVNTDANRMELSGSWAVLGEALQTVLRKNHIVDSYETVKSDLAEWSRDRASFREYVSRLPIAEDDIARLLRLEPESYTGLASHLVDYAKATSHSDGR